MSVTPTTRSHSATIPLVLTVRGHSLPSTGTLVLGAQRGAPTSRSFQVGGTSATSVTLLILNHHSQVWEQPRHVSAPTTSLEVTAFVCP